PEHEMGVARTQRRHSVGESPDDLAETGGQRTGPRHVVEEFEETRLPARACRFAFRPGDLLRVPRGADDEKPHSTPQRASPEPGADPMNSGIVACPAALTPRPVSTTAIVRSRIW